MADTQQMHRGGGGERSATESIKSMLPDKGPSAGQVMAVAVLFPVGGILLALAGITLTGTLIGLAITAPLFVIFSPVIVPAAIAICLAVLGFLSSGAFGLTALSSLSYIFNYLRGMRSRVPEQMDYAKRRMQEAAGQIGQRTKDLGQGIQSRAGQEGGGRT